MNIIGMSNVSFLTKNIQYTTLKLNFVPENIGSCKVIEKCGFTLEGTLRQAVYYQKVEYLNVYALMRN